MYKKILFDVMKEYFKGGGRKSFEIVAKSGGTKAEAKKDIRSGIAGRLKNKLKLEKDPVTKRNIVKAIKELADLFIVTVPVYTSLTWVYERTGWLKEHFGIDSKHIVYTASKELVSGDIFIDDRPEYTSAWKEHNPNGISVLWSQEYNKQHDNTCDYRINDWNKLIQIVKNARSKNNT